MPATFPIYPAHTALLSMDCLEGIVSIYTKGEKEASLARAASALGDARAAGIKVIHVRVGFPGFLRLVREIRGSAQLSRRSTSETVLGSAQRGPCRGCPKEGEILITRDCVSAFAVRILG